MISEELFRRLEGYIHTREIGLINVKGIKDPIKVFEPYEVMIDFPSELDPLKRPKAPDHQKLEQVDPGNGGKKKQGVFLDYNSVSFLANTFSTLYDLCRKAEGRKVEVSEIREELTRRWRVIKDALKGGLAK